jgi:hypothetical protein
VLTLRASGPCQWLLWDTPSVSYRCGVLAACDPKALGTEASKLRRWWHRQIHRAARRWIAAGVGCDCSMEDAPQSQEDSRR